MTKIEIAIPVYNEEDILEESIGVLRDFLRDNLKREWSIIIVDNASNDRTLEIARDISERYQEVNFAHLDEKGRGRALRRTWLKSDADIVAYMDVDLATDLNSFPALVKAIEEDGYDIAIGSRLMSDSKVERSFKREFLSRGYNLIIRALFNNKFNDAQCGFKALSRHAAQDLLPLTVDNGWFFDTELLLLAGSLGYRVREIPVMWTEASKTTVNIIRTVTRDLKGLLRLRFFPSAEVRARKKQIRSIKRLQK